VKKFRVRFTPEASRFIKKLHPDIKKLIRNSIDILLKDPLKGDELHGELKGFLSFKPHRYRIIYKTDLNEHWIDIYYVGHRRDVYENFKRLIEQMRLCERRGT